MLYSDMHFPCDTVDFNTSDIESAIDELIKIFDLDPKIKISKSVPVAEKVPAVVRSRLFQKGDRIWHNTQAKLATVVEDETLDDHYIKFKCDNSEKIELGHSTNITLILAIEHKIIQSISFITALKSLWQGLIIRKVKFIKKGGRGFAQ